MTVDSAVRLSFDVFAARGPLRPQHHRRTADRHWSHVAPHLRPENRELIEDVRARSIASQDRSTFDAVVALVRMEEGW